MAVETGAIFNHVTFGVVNSAFYGICVTGDAVYDAPKRATKLVSVPGRNGAVAIDQGYWENITLTYPAGVFGDDQQDFAEAIRAYRNALASQVGYLMLTDSYHPDEYRMAMFVDGMEVDPKSYGRAGQFSLKFECKPQRWLNSGRTTYVISNGRVLTNPTLFNASPLLTVLGAGTINLGDQSITVKERELGTITVLEGGTDTAEWSNDGLDVTLMVPTTNLNTGDRIKLGALKSTDYNGVYGDESIVMVSDANLNGAAVTWQASIPAIIWCSVPAEEYTYGTAEVRKHYATLRAYTDGVGTIESKFGITVDYNGAGTFIINVSGNNWSDFTLQWDDVTAYSTKTVQEKVYIDLDVGEAYWIQDGKAVDANNMVTLGSDLPVLKPGDNEITFDNTITRLTIQPRWWQL